MKIICAWCGERLGEKSGEGETHTICAACRGKVNREGRGCVQTGKCEPSVTPLEGPSHVSIRP